MLSNAKWQSVEQHERPPHRRVEECSIVEEWYTFGKKIGEGSFGLVFEGTNNKTGKKWAIKKVNKEKASRCKHEGLRAGKSTIMLLEREVGILKKVHHKHIIGLNEVIESPKKMYLVMELCLLGELKILLDKRGPFTEITTRHIITCLIDAIVYLHRNGIVHRDLKLENILVADQKGDAENPLYEIKLTDFGLSVEKGAGRDAMLQTACGTPVYMAPEIIQNHDYTQQCDIWSVGVILYALLSKNFPFIAPTEDLLYDTIKKGVVVYTTPVWSNVSASAKDLIERLLTVDPAYRLTASEVNTHPWIQGYDDLDLSLSRPVNVLDLMKDFNKYHPGENDSYDEYGEEEEDFNVYNDSTSDANKARAAEAKQKEKMDRLNQRQQSNNSENSAASSTSKKRDRFIDNSKPGKPRKNLPNLQDHTKYNHPLSAPDRSSSYTGPRVTNHIPVQRNLTGVSTRELKVPPNSKPKSLLKK